MRAPIARAGSRRPRHLVLVRAVAVCHPRLAGPDRRPRRLLPDGHQLHRAGDHQPLGQPDDHDRARVHGRGPVLRRRHPLCGPGRRRTAHVQVARHRRRSARADRQVRRRRAACLGRVGRDVQPGRALRREPRRGLPQVLQQAVERDAAGAELAWPAALAGARSFRAAGAPRGPVDPVQALQCKHRDRRGHRQLRLPGLHQCRLRVCMERVLRLVSRGGQGAPPRG